MESDSFRSSSVLGDLNTNIQDDVVRNASPLSVSRSLKNSSSSSDNEIEYDINDQENKPPGSVESASSTDSFKFKKPLVPNEDNTLNSLIDGLSHLKLGSTSASEKRFNSFKWTTPLKKKAAPLNESRVSSDCSLFEKNISHSISNDTETVENISLTISCNKSDKETSISHNDDDCSEYYDCSDEENALVEQARVSELSSDHCNTADSSFHSVSEKEHLASLNAANSTFVMSDSNSMNQANIAEMNQAQDSDQAYILEKYLTEQDFKLEISLSDVSFNAVTGGLDFELGKRQSVCSQTETPVAGSLFSFEHQEKTKVFSTGHQDVNDVTIQPDQFNYMGLFAKENEPQTEDTLFNLLSDCLVQNETCSMFDVEPDENIFALGRLSQAGFLQFSDAEKDALMEHSARKSLQLQSSDITSNQIDVDESQENVQVQNVPMQVNVEIEPASEIGELDKTVSVDEIAANSSPSSYPEQTSDDQFSSSFKVIDHSGDVEASNENSSICAVESTSAIDVEPAATFEESLVENNQHSSFNELNQTTNPKAITTIDEIFTEMNKNSKNLNESVEFLRKTPSPSSLNATIDTESMYDDSFSEKSNGVADLESTLNVAERDLEQSNDLPTLNQTVDLEVSQNSSLQVEGGCSFYQNLSVTVDLEKTPTTDDYLDEENQDALKSNPNVDSETSRASFDEIEAENSTNVPDYDENSELSQNLSKLNQTSNFSITTTVSEEMSLNQTIPVTNENLAEEFFESPKNRSVNSESTEMVDEIISEKSPDRKQLSEVSSSDSFPILYKQCQEVVMNRTVSFETTELTPETIVEKSPNKEELNESSNSEISPVSDTNLSEPFQELAVNSEITDADVDEKSPDQKQTNELDNLETNSMVVESFAEQNQELTVVIDESTNRSMNSLNVLNEEPFKLIRNVSFNLDITQIINDKIAEDQDDAENEKSTHLNATPVTNEKIIDRSRESMELSQIDNSEVTCINEEVIEDMKFGDPNKTYELEIVEKLQNDSFAPVLISPELNETINLEVTRVIDENVVDDSENINKTFELKPKIVETTFVSVPERSYLNETIDLEVTRICEDPDEFTDLDQQNKTIDLEAPTAIEVDSSVLIQESFHLNSSIDVEVTRTYEENAADFTDLDQRNETIDLEAPTGIEIDSSVLIQESPHLNNPVDMDVTRTYEENAADFTDLETPTATKVDSSVLIQESSHLNSSVGMEVTRTYEENSADFADLDQRNKTIDLEAPTAIEIDPCMRVQESSHLNDTVDLEVTRIIEENPENLVDSDKPNQTVDLTTSTTIENYSSVPIQEQTELNETVDLKMIRPTYEDTVAYSSESVILEYDAEALLKTEGSVSVVPIFSTESILKNSSRRLNITNDELASIKISPSNQDDDTSNVEEKIEVDEEPNVSSNTFREDTMEEQELSDSSNSKSCDNTVIIHESPSGRRCNSPARFDRYTASMPEPASPIPPNSPTELSNKWQTQFDLSSIADHLECYTGRDSPSNSSDEMDVTDPIDSNIAPEMLQTAKQPPGSNWSVSNLESIPEMNETDSNEEPNKSEVQLEQDTKDPIPLEEIITGDNQFKPEPALNRTLTSTFSLDQGTGDELSSAVSQTSPQAEPESGLNESVIVAAPNNPNDSIFKTPITKLPSRSDLSALNDSNFNADYCFARTASAKSIQSSRNSLVSPRFPSIFSPYGTPSRRLRRGTPKNSGDIPPSLLDMSIGCFENYTANQAGPSLVPENELNKTVDVDEEPRVEETKLLCIDDPFKKVNVKTQTHDTELFDLRAENAKLKEDLNGLAEITEAMADKEAQLKEALQVLVHNEAELKKTVLQLEDDNRLLNNKYELLTEYSNELLARRNAELDEAEEKIRILEAKLQEYSNKTKAASK